MTHDKTCNILGRYCWTHRVKTDTGIPYWPIAHHGEYTHYSPWARNEVTGQGYTESIIWANGDIDARRTMYQPCSMCNRRCTHPVRIDDKGDNYKEIGQTLR